MFYESPRFPDCIAFGAQGGPSFFTEVVTVASGFEQRNQIWQQGRLTWDVSHGVRDDADMQLLRNFFRGMKGRLHGFRFKDHTDFACPDNGGVGVMVPYGDGSDPAAWQLAKRYTTEGAPFDLRIIRKPRPGSVRVYVDGVERVADLIVDPSSGLITFGDPLPDPAAILTWSGEFDVPVRFDIDDMKIGIVDKTSSGVILEDWQQIPIIELRQ